MLLNSLWRPLLQAHHRRHWRLLLAVLLGVVSWFAFKPALPSHGWAHIDKLQHISAFVALSVVASLGWAPRLRLTRHVAAGLMAYGLFIEAVQTWLPSRSGNLADWVADGVGIALGLAMTHRLRRPD
jgi:VanZ family protein